MRGQLEIDSDAQSAKARDQACVRSTTERCLPSLLLL